MQPPTLHCDNDPDELPPLGGLEQPLEVGRQRPEALPGLSTGLQHDQQVADGGCPENCLHWEVPHRLLRISQSVRVGAGGSTSSTCGGSGTEGRSGGGGSRGGADHPTARAIASQDPRAFISSDPGPMPAGTSGVPWIMGRSMLSSPPPPPPLLPLPAGCLDTLSSPLRVSNTRRRQVLPSPSNSAAAAARVACPHSGTSLAGVNHRRRKRSQAALGRSSLAHSRKAVSLRFISAPGRAQGSAVSGPRSPVDWLPQAPHRGH